MFKKTYDSNVFRGSRCLFISPFSETVVSMHLKHSKLTLVTTLPILTNLYWSSSKADGPNCKKTVKKFVLLTNNLPSIKILGLKFLTVTFWSSANFSFKSLMVASFTRCRAAKSLKMP